MRRRQILALAATAVCVAACAQEGSRESHETIARSESPLAGRASDGISAVWFRNSDNTPGLGSQVPVIVSSKDGVPNAAFLFGCASNNGTLYKAFGYPADHSLGFDIHYDSFDLLRDDLTAQAGEEVPIRTLGCPTEPASAKQVLQVFRRIDADASKGQSSYYLRFADDPFSIYGLGCPDILDGLGYSKGLDDATPVNQAVFDQWAKGAQAIRERDINCYDVASRPLPPVDRALTPRPPLPSPAGETKAYVVSGHKFPGINSDSVLYLVSNGRGYPISCGSNIDRVLGTFGLGTIQDVPMLDKGDPIFLASHPDEQPVLSCTNRNASVFMSADEQPPSPYFQLGSSSQLVHFTCSDVERFFLGTVTGTSPAPDAGAPPSVPMGALPYLLIDPNMPSMPGSILQVGCNRPEIPATGTGLYGQYFNDTSLSSCPVTRIDPTVDFDWDQGSPERGVRTDAFSARWTGEVQPEFSETYTFSTYSDDGTRVWVDGKLLVDDWNNHAPTEKSGSVTLVAGKRYSIAMEYFDFNGPAQTHLYWSSASQPRELVPSARLYPIDPNAPNPPPGCSASGTGLKLILCTGQTPTCGAPQLDPKIHHGWIDSAHGFTARWEGFVQPEHSDAYSFTTETDDGARLWVNGKLIIDDWKSHELARTTGTIALFAGQRYTIRMDYFDSGGAAEAHLYWSSANQPMEIVPSARLYPAPM